MSDSLGETAEFVSRAALSQFDGEKVDIRRVPFVKERRHLEEIVAEASCGKSVIAFTLVLKELRDCLLHLASQKNVPTVDILGPMMDAISEITCRPPKLEPGLLRKLDQQYYDKVEAVEFAVHYDDGMDARGVLEADIVLIGVSRTSKTPVSMYLAHKQIKVANVPLVPEVPPPQELFSVPRKKVVGLTTSPQLLYQVRQERLKTLGFSRPGYADYQRILQELEYAENIMKRIGCVVIDVTNKAVEETAARILELHTKGEQNG